MSGDSPDPIRPEGVDGPGGSSAARVDHAADGHASAMPAPAATPYVAVAASPQFQDLRRRFRRFVFPMTALFLVWYFLYVLLAAYAPAFMSTKVAGNINIGLILGLLQFVSTFAITIAYVRWADRQIDPLAEQVHDMCERAGVSD